MLTRLLCRAGRKISERLLWRASVPGATTSWVCLMFFLTRIVVLVLTSMYAVATDVASRGIDVKGVTHVINYDMPKVHTHLYTRCYADARSFCRILKITPIALGVQVAPA